jgi:putative transposase
MTDTIEPMTRSTLQDGSERGEQQIARQLVDRARAEGIDLIGPGGMLTGLTKTVLETALEEELSSHLGYDKHDPAGRNGENSRNGTRAKTVLTEIGPVTIDVPRDRDGTFDPVIVRKRQRRLGGVDQMVLSLTARGLTTGEVSAHLAEVYGAHVGKDQVSRITEAVVAEMNEWQNRPLDRVYPVVFIDAIVVKVRDGQVTNKPFYVVIGVTTAGERDILGVWAGDGGEGAQVLAGGVDRAGDPRRRRRVHRGVRRTERPTRRDHHHLAAGRGADLRHPPAAQHLPVRRTARLGRDRQGPATGVHRRQRRPRRATVPGVRRPVGRQVPRRSQAVAVGVDRVHPVPGLRSLLRNRVWTEPGATGVVVEWRDRAVGRITPARRGGSSSGCGPWQRGGARLPRRPGRVGRIGRGFF